MSVKELKEAAAKSATGTRSKKAQTPVEEPLDKAEFGAVLMELKKKLDPAVIKQREGWRDRNGNVQTVDYVEWHTVADILDETAPNWSHEIRHIREMGDFMLVVVAITIDGVTREGVGTGSSRSEMGIKKAEHDALKRAAVKFGVARELYHKEFEAADRAQAAPAYGGGQSYSGPPQNAAQRPANANGGGSGGYAPAQKPADPVAKTLADMITTKQLGMIRAVAREAGVDADEECVNELHCAVTELSRRAASYLIDHLRGLGERGQGQDRQIAPQPNQQLVNTVRILLHNLGIPEADAAKDASQGREATLERLSPDELAGLKKELEA